MTRTPITAADLHLFEERARKLRAEYIASLFRRRR